MYFVPVVLASAGAVRLAWALCIEARPMHDCVWYIDRAREMAAGNGYAVDGVPTAYWPVGFPAFLGAIFFVFGPSLPAAKLANVVLSTLTVGLAGVIARQLYRSEWAGKITMLILAVYPNYVAYVSIISSEILFVFLMLLGVAALVTAQGRWRVLAFSGLVFTLACLTRAQAVFIPLIAAAVVLLADTTRGSSFRWRAMESAVVCLVMAAAMIPWTIRNYHVFGHFVFVSTNGGVNLLIGNHPDATGNYSLVQ